MDKNKKKYMLYYVFGTILCVISIILIILSITLPLTFKEEFPSYLGWICLVVTVISMIILFFGIYYIKKAKFLKVNNKEINK